MSDDFKINDATYSGTKEVDQNLKFDTNLLQDWMHEHIPRAAHHHRYACWQSQHEGN